MEYKEKQKLWHDTFTKITGFECESYITNTYGNGEEILDGNPIYSAIIGDGKCVRIIECDEEVPEHFMYFDKRMLGDVEYREFVAHVTTIPHISDDDAIIVTIKRFFNGEIIFLG